MKYTWQHLLTKELITIEASTQDLSKRTARARLKHITDPDGEDLIILKKIDGETPSTLRVLKQKAISPTKTVSLVRRTKDKKVFYRFRFNSTSFASFAGYQSFVDFKQRKFKNINEAADYVGNLTPEAVEALVKAQYKAEMKPKKPKNNEETNYQ
jgi:hypothetical protein